MLAGKVKTEMYTRCLPSSCASDRSAGTTRSDALDSTEARPHSASEASGQKQLDSGHSALIRSGQFPQALIGESTCRTFRLRSYGVRYQERKEMDEEGEEEEREQQGTRCSNFALYSHSSSALATEGLAVISSPSGSLF